MPIIILTEPFIRHYAGSVFKVSDAIGVSGWDDDDRVREKQSCYDQRFYFLPDNGKGTPAELPLPYAFDCPENILAGINLKSGPCRITSVSKGLEKNIGDPYYAEPLPLGKGKIMYSDSEKYAKNVLTFDLGNEEQPDTALINNRVTGEIQSVNRIAGHPAILSFEEFEPGFFEVSLLKSTQKIHHFTLIKCFPMVVQLTDIRGKYNITKTIW